MPSHGPGIFRSGRLAGGSVLPDPRHACPRPEGGARTCSRGGRSSGRPGLVGHAFHAFAGHFFGCRFAEQVGEIFFTEQTDAAGNVDTDSSASIVLDTTAGPSVVGTLQPAYSSVTVAIPYTADEPAEAQHDRSLPLLCDSRRLHEDHAETDRCHQRDRATGDRETERAERKRTEQHSDRHDVQARSRKFRKNTASSSAQRAASTPPRPCSRSAARTWTTWSRSASSRRHHRRSRVVAAPG